MLTEPDPQLFFGIRKPFLALLDILPLTFIVFKLTALAGKIDPRAQYLLIPYSAWVSLATYLNGESGPSPRI